jgi:FlaA1/EpsC-like NDP-sugar epimerase
MDIFFNNLFQISRKNKKLLLILIDSILLFLAVIVSLNLRLGIWYWPENKLLWIIIIAPLVGIPIFIRFGLYRAIIRFIGFNAIWEIIKAVTLYALFWGILVYFSAIDGIPRSVILINWLLSIVAIGGCRVLIRWLFFEFIAKNNAENKRVVVYGAGAAGRQLALSLKDSIDYTPIAFVDDSTDLQGQSIHGLKVISKENLEFFIRKNNISEILLAIPSLIRARRTEIINYLEPFPVHVLSLPSLEDLAKGNVKVVDLREVSIADILGRNGVSANKNLLDFNIKNKVVLVTGAGGSIGSELCRQILQLNPKILILFEQSEFALYKVDKELAKLNYKGVKIITMLGSVQNKNRLLSLFKKFEVQTIYHAAAYKHVSIVESNTTEGVDNNVFGTLNCSIAAYLGGVETFVLISTDKAVRPTNIMGASKRLAEMVIQELSNNTKEFIKLIEGKSIENKRNLLNHTKFSIVRFGNVLNSSGSVVPLFNQQIKDGGPVTVTDPNVLRYFMTTTEAVELVIQTGAMGKGGEVFVLDMGEPVLILDLAKKMIRLSGMSVKDVSNPNGDIEILFTGLSPGEKLFEELLIGVNTSSTDNPMIMKAIEESISSSELKLILDELTLAITNNNHDKLRQSLMRAVPGFRPESKIIDNLYNG